MEKKLQDYAHLYLGCQGQLKFKKTYGSPKKTTEVLTAEVLDKLTKLPSIYSFKPYLRPLSSITKEERAEYEKIAEADLYKEFKLPVYYYAAITQFLVSKGFDLYGLIDAGLAIDATTLTSSAPLSQ